MQATLRSIALTLRERIAQRRAVLSDDATAQALEEVALALEAEAGVKWLGGTFGYAETQEPQWP